MKLPFFKHGKERCNLKQIASFKKYCAFWPECVLIFFESNSVPTLFLQKVPNKYYLFDINRKLKMVDLWGGAIWYPPKKSTIFDLPFWHLVVWDDTCLQSLQILAALRHPLPTLKNVGFGGSSILYIYIYIYLFIYIHTYLHTKIDKHIVMHIFCRYRLMTYIGQVD